MRKLLLSNLKELEQDKEATLANVQAISDEDLEAIIGSTKDGKWDMVFSFFVKFSFKCGIVIYKFFEIFLVKC